MLDFELDEEQKMLVEAIGRFVDGRIQKVFRDAEEDGVIPADVRQAGWEFGLLTTGIPEEFGGFGEYSAVTNALAMEAFAYGDLAIALSIGVPALVGLPIQLAGTDEQKATYLPQFCEAEPPRVSGALVEPVVLFDPRELATKAVKENGSYRLTGIKSMVPLAADAQLFLVYALEDGQTQAFLVPRETEGLSVGNQEKLMGLNALDTYRVTFDDCQIPVDNKLGGSNGIDFELILSHNLVGLGAAAVGVAKAAYEYARDYAKVRVQFDEPIGHRQSIAFMLAEMAIEVDAARLMVWETAWKLDKGKNAAQEATIMKQYVDQVVLQVADRAVQTLGGYGYVREYPTELWLRNARGIAALTGLAMA